jgi:hypothetical protein
MKLFIFPSFDLETCHVAVTSCHDSIRRGEIIIRVGREGVVVANDEFYPRVISQIHPYINIGWVVPFP